MAGLTMVGTLIGLLAALLVVALVGTARVRALWTRLPILLRTLCIAGVVALVLVVVLAWNDEQTLSSGEQARARAAGVSVSCARPEFTGGAAEYLRFKQCLMATGTSREDADYRGDLIYCSDMMTNRYGSIPRDSLQSRFEQDPDWYQKEYLACMAQRGHAQEAELLRRLAESRR
jgi:hypothetical protein